MKWIKIWKQEKWVKNQKEEKRKNETNEKSKNERIDKSKNTIDLTSKICPAISKERIE